MENLKELGLSVNDDLILEANELEEELIQKEVLPILTKTIEPALKQVKRELVLVVDYKPGQPLSVHLSRKRNFTDGLGDTKVILPDPAVSHSTKVKLVKSRTKNPMTKLRIIHANGSIIEEDSSADTFRRFVVDAGIMKVRELGIIRCRIPLVSNTLDEKYKSRQKPLGGGWYLMTNTSTMDKKKDIEYIAEALGIKIKVEII